MQSLCFSKMHALGNDFAIIDQTKIDYKLDKKTILALSNRRSGIGFDQLLVVESPKKDGVDFHYRIFNADGSEVNQCGNGARCFALFVRKKGLTNKKQLAISTNTELIQVEVLNDNNVQVDMGRPSFSPKAVPFSSPEEQLTYTIDSYQFGITNIGNPHCTFLVNDLQNAKVAKIGAFLNTCVLFPKGVNVGFMQIINKNNIKLRVYERGVGETSACGSGAGAAVGYGVRLNLLNNQVTAQLNGGNLIINYCLGENIIIQGEATFIYEGEINLQK